MNEKSKAFFSGLILGGIGTSLLIFGTIHFALSNIKNHSQKSPEPSFPGEIKLYEITPSLSERMGIPKSH